MDEVIYKHVLPVTEQAAGTDWILSDDVTSWKQDREMHLIIGGVAFMGLLAVLPQFGWFQTLTGIDGWVNFLRALLG